MPMIARSTLIVATAAALSLAACTDRATDAGAEDAFGFRGNNGFKGNNGLATIGGIVRLAGLTGQNGVMSSHGLSLQAGLISEQGLSSTSGLMTTDEGRKTVSYLVRCALGPNDTLFKQYNLGQSYAFAG